MSRCNVLLDQLNFAVSDVVHNINLVNEDFENFVLLQLFPILNINSKPSVAFFLFLANNMEEK